MPRLSLWLLLCALPAAGAPQPTATTMTQLGGIPVYGAALTFEAAVNAVTGNITFIVDGQPTKTFGVDSVGRVFTSLSFSSGAHTVGASFSGDDVYLSSTAVPLTIVVGKASTSVQMDAGTAQIGQPVTISALVGIVSPGSGAVGGTVAFLSDLISMTPISGCGAAPVQNGAAKCNTSFPSPGLLVVMAHYSGDANTSAGGNTLQLTVGKAAAGVYLAAAPDPPVWGTPVSVNALVLGAQNVAAPTGTVTFSSGGKTAATQTLGADGHAALAASYAVGNYAVNAVYNGDANYQTTAPVTFNLSVGKAPTVLTVSSDPGQIDQPVTLRASVSLAAGNGSITGTVDFTAGGKAVTGCTGISISGGSAACKTTFTQLGAFTLGATFSGDANTLPSSSSVAAITGKAVAGFFLASAPAAPVFGVPVTLDALLLGAAGVAAPGGTVVFSEAATTFATQPVGADGRASFASPLGAGLHSITAAYSGDANYQAATSPAVTLTVAKAGTVTSLTAVAGGPFTAVVTVAPPGAGSPTGMVQFRNGTAVIGTAPLIAQGSAFTAVLASAATGSITAWYTGDANFSAGVSDPATVYPPQTLVTVTSDRNPSTAGQAVTFTVAVSAAPRALATPPTGAVTLSADGANLQTANLSGGQTSFHATLGIGSHTVTASYSGDATYGAAIGTLTQVFGAAGTSLTVTGSAPVTTYGQNLTLTALLGPQAGAAPPAGMIQFTDGATALGAATTKGGSASLPVNLAAGVHAITASWLGDGTWGAASAQLSETVNKASTATALAISGGALMATVTVDAPGAGSPGGSVRFLDAAAGTLLATVVLSGAAASAPLLSAAGTVVAMYSGDDNFLGGASAALPMLSVTNAASYLSVSFAADEIVTLFGPNLATATASASGAPVDSLAGAAVKVRDSAGMSRTAPLFFASPAQAAILMPAGLAPGPATLTVTNAGRVLSASIAVTAVAPGLFTADSSGQGAPAAQVIRVHGDGTQDDPQPATSRIDLSDPNTAVYLVLYGTGIRHAAAAPACTIALQPVPVLFAGAQGTLPGLDQVNVLLPPGLKGSGAVPLILTVDGRESNSVTLYIR
jgi:uncharacterized protein (TIGR03437 family)